jgi:hypothetical protein
VTNKKKGINLLSPEEWDSSAGGRKEVAAAAAWFGF